MTLNRKNVGYFAKIICVLLVITMAVALLLSLVNMITKDKIAENEAKKLQTAISELFKTSSATTEKLDVDIKTNDNDIKKSFTALYAVTDASQLVGYYAEVAPVGYKGEIKMLVGIDAAGSVCGIQILSHSETVGLGDKIENKSFLDKFLGNTTPQDPEKVDKISTATYSSTAVKLGVKTALVALESFFGGVTQ